MGIEPTLPQLTEKGQSFNEHGYQAGAFISANFNSFVQNIVKITKDHELASTTVTFMSTCAFCKHI